MTRSFEVGSQSAERRRLFPTAVLLGSIGSIALVGCSEPEKECGGSVVPAAYGSSDARLPVGDGYVWVMTDVRSDNLVNGDPSDSSLRKVALRGYPEVDPILDNRLQDGGISQNSPVEVVVNDIPVQITTDDLEVKVVCQPASTLDT